MTTIDVNVVADTSFLFDVDDTFVFYPFDVSDVIEGVNFSYTMFFNVAVVNDTMSSIAFFFVVSFTRDLVVIVMYLYVVDLIDVNALVVTDSSTFTDLIVTYLQARRFSISSSSLVVSI